jgi:hypothetical protein
VQVDPIKPTLKAPGIKLLKLQCDMLLSIFAFKFKLRRYNEEVLRLILAAAAAMPGEALASLVVGRCMLNR